VPSLVLVTAQLVALVALVLPWGAQWHGGGWPLLVAAAAVGAWTLRHNRPGNFGIMPEPIKRAELVTTGPYAYVRHPMYLAVLLFGAGMLAGWQGWLHALAFAVLAIALHFKATREESLLRRRFPSYADYAARTSKILPGLW
jgi:protein-S-isoprenylcysteine O-methyltransferase Ste14